MISDKLQNGFLRPEHVEPLWLDRAYMWHIGQKERDYDDFKRRERDRKRKGRGGARRGAMSSLPEMYDRDFGDQGEMVKSAIRRAKAGKLD